MQLSPMNGFWSWKKTKNPTVLWMFYGYSITKEGRLYVGGRVIQSFTTLGGLEWLLTMNANKSFIHLAYIIHNQSLLATSHHNSIIRSPPIHSVQQKKHIQQSLVGSILDGVIHSCVLRYGRFIFFLAVAPTPWKRRREVGRTRRNHRKPRRNWLLHEEKTRELKRDMAMHVGVLVARELLFISANFQRSPWPGGHDVVV